MSDGSIITIDGEVIEKSDSPRYITMVERLYGKPGPPVDNPVHKAFEEARVAAKTGSIEPELPLEEKKIMLFRDTLLTFPELWFQVHVVGPPEDTRGMAQLFMRGDCSWAETLDEADLVVFTGGPDVSPVYYGEEEYMIHYGSKERDDADIPVYLECLERGIPMTGICRGAQFLAVMNGYKLYQHIDGHHGDHQMWDCRDKIMIDKVSSVHHQSVIGGKGMEIVGTTQASTERHLNNTRVQKAEKTPFMDIEAYFIRDTCCFGVQGHPEYKGYDSFSKWYLDKLYQYITLNPDLSFSNIEGRLRLNEDVLKERNALGGQSRIIDIGEKG